MILGLKPKITYNWAKQPNGKFTIFRVPVLAPFKRKFKNGDEEQIAELSPQDAPAVLNDFNSGLNRGRYRRLHIGHHDDEGYKDQIGAGYLDNLVSDNGTLYFSDLIEIEPDIFDAIYNNKYPFLSPEFLFGKKSLDSVALMETRSPYFDFPNLILAKKPIKFSDEQTRVVNMRSQVIRFQAQSDSIDFCGNCNDKKTCGDKTIKFDCPYGKQRFTEEENSMPVDEKDMSMDMETSESAPADPMQEINSKLDKLLTLLSGVLDSDEEEDEQNQIPPQDANSVAMQAVNDQIAKFQREIDTLKAANSTKSEEERLRAICDNNGLNFQEERLCLLKFQGSDAQKSYVDLVEVRAAKYPKHRMTKFAESFKFSSPTELVDRFPEECRSSARKHIDNYRDTINQENEQSAMVFKGASGTEEDYVRHMVFMDTGFKLPVGNNGK